VTRDLSVKKKMNVVHQHQKLQKKDIAN